MEKHVNDYILISIKNNNYIDLASSIKLVILKLYDY